IVALTLADLIRQRPSAVRFAAYGTVMGIGYLVHLGTVVFLIPALATSAALRVWFQKTTVRRELALFVPIIVLLAWYFVLGPEQRPGDMPGDPLKYRDFETKLLFLTTSNWELMRFGGTAATVMMGLLAACVASAAMMELRPRALARLPVLE